MNYLKPDYRKDFFVYTNIDYEVMDSHELEWPVSNAKSTVIYLLNAMA